MLSTSILYCNKLDDRQLQQLETMVVEGGGGSAEAAAGGGRSSSNNSALGHPNHVQQRPPHLTSNSTSPKVIAHHQHHHQQQLRRRNLALSTASTNPPSDVFSDVASASAIITSPTSPTPTSSATSSVVNKNRFRVRYLGCNSCDPRRHRLDGGIASYQKPLLDLYATVLRRSVVLRSLYAYSIAAVNQVADISAHGIVVAERDRFATALSTSPSVRPCSETNGIIANRNHHHRHLQPQPQLRRPNSSVSETVPHSTSQDVSFTAHSSAATVETVVTKVITPLSNILLFAAVRFQHRSRSSAKKSAGNRRGGRRQVVGVAFVPLSCSEAVLDKNAFVSLPAKQRFLLGLPHPPLFACVLQKVNAVHRLECHLFVCPSADDAIRMCASVAEHRRRGGAIGRLQLPLPGTMGTYSYAPSLSTAGSSRLGLATATPTVHSSSGAASVVSNRSSKQSVGGYSISELSSSAATFIRNSSSHAFSDIEEEEDQDDGGASGLRRRLQSANNLNNNGHQFRPPFSSTDPQHSTSALRMAALFQGRAVSNGNSNNFPHPPPSSERDLPVQRILDQQRAPKKLVRNDNGSNNGVGDSLSWAELSSISSAFISTKSEPPPPSHRNHSQQAVAAAQRDYRLQSYKCPENFVLPDLHSTTTATKDAEQKSNCDSTAASIITSAAGSKKKQKHNAHGQLLPETTVKVLDRATSTELNHGTNSNKWLSAVGDELQSNRLFAKASAIASQEQRERQDGARAPSSDHHHRQNNTTNGFHEDSPPAPFTRSSSTPRFFGDTIRGRPKTAPKPQVKAAHLKNIYSSSPSVDLRDAAVLSSREFIESGRLREQLKLANGFNENNGNIRSHQENHPSCNLQSTISNSIFFDEEISSSSSKSGRSKGVNQKAKSQPNLLSGDLQKRQRQPDKSSAVPKLPVVEPVPSVVLYLPTETSNVGVKCFNKSTPVDRWSTMMPATAASTGSLRDTTAQVVDGCELCSFELEAAAAAAAADNCEECCQLCQSFEPSHNHLQQHHKASQRRPQSSSVCPECMADEDHGNDNGVDDDDEIILDEAILQNFSNGGNSHTLPHHSQQHQQQQHHHQQQPKHQSASEDGSRRRRRREEQLSLAGGQNSHTYHPPMIREDMRLGDATDTGPYKTVASHRKTTFLGRIRQLGSSIFGSKSHPPSLAVAPSSTNRSRSLLWGRNSLKKLKGRRSRAMLTGKAPMAKEQQQQKQLHQVNRIFLPLAPNEYSGARVYSEHYLNPPPLPPPQKTTSSRAKESDGEANGDSSGSSGGRRQRSPLKDAKNKATSEQSTPPKPFFISHPSEFNPAQVLSISSDSGMEEYDCHSSGEHSPLAVNGLPSKNKTAAQELENRNHSNNNRAPSAKMTGAKLTRSSPVKPQSQQSRPVSAKTPPTSAKSAISGHWSETNLQNELGYMP